MTVFAIQTTIGTLFPWESVGYRVQNITVRPARTEDAEPISAIYNQAVATSTATFDTRPETVEDRRAWLAGHEAMHSPVLVAEADGRVLGWASLSPYSDRCAYAATAEVSTYVDGAHTGRGTGTLLTRALLEAGAEAGMHALIARICTENAASLAMAERLGFEHVGVMREVGRKFGRWLDVAVLEKVLEDSPGTPLTGDTR